MRTVAGSLAPCLQEALLVVSTTKGIEEDTLQTMSAVLTEVLGAPWKMRISVLSGPSFAAEVARGLPTAVTVAARVETVADEVQGIFSSSRFRVYTTTDLVGVEVGGAVKNVIALAAGVSDGLGCGYSARAALITRGLAEMTRLAVRMEAEPQTLSGLSGMGDLVLTCTSDLSRNHKVGVRLGRGEQLATVLQGMSMIAEGVRTCRSVFALAQRLGVEMPIVEQMYALLYDGKSPQQVVTDLLARGVKPEFSRWKN
jgi:glycerol-3-phosphate dehydrogenase (NAD(P)+)